MDGLQKRLRESVQLRLCAALSLAIALVALAAGVFSFVSALHEAHELQDDTLHQVAVLFDRQAVSVNHPGHRDVAGDDEETRVIVQYLNASASVQGGDGEPPLPLPADLADGLHTLQIGGEPFRVLVRTTLRGERIAVAQETDARDQDARESALRSLVPFLVLVPVLLLVVVDLVRKLFRPIAQLAAELDGRDEQALHPINERHVPSEVRPFVVAINALLGRVSLAMDSQGRFVADAAHELRSPLTALSLQAQRLANAPMSQQARERLLPLQQGIDRGRQLVAQLLDLTRAQAGAQSQSQAVSVQGVFRQVLENLLPLAELKQLDVGVVGEQDAWLLAPPMDLQTLIANLVDNAIRYTPVGGQIDLSVSVQGATARVQVRDNGPGIAPHERQRVFDPFYRGMGSEQVGSGLGLAIVSAIAQRMGATLSLAFSDEAGQRGLLVTLDVPRMAD